MGLFSKPCLVCREKDARISDLQKQIQMLSAVAYPTHLQGRVSPQAIEADKILSGNTDPVELSPEELEAAKLITGAYYSDQVDLG